MFSLIPAITRQVVHMDDMVQIFAFQRDYSIYSLRDIINDFLYSTWNLKQTHSCDAETNKN